MHRIYIFWLACLLTCVGMAQVDESSNLVSNSQFQAAQCGDNNLPCPHFDQCVDDWLISHGSPNLVGTSCPLGSGEDRHIQLISQTHTALGFISEGIFQTLDLIPGTYRLFLRIRTTAQDPGIDQHLIIGFDQGLTHSPGGCQEPFPFSVQASPIVNQHTSTLLNVWEWVIADFSVQDTDRNQLFITVNNAGTPTGAQGIVQIDCIYVFPTGQCEDKEIIIAPPGLVLPIDGTTRAKQICIGESQGSVQVLPGSDASLLAGDFILLSHNFAASHDMIARIVPCPDNVFDDEYRPPCSPCADTFVSMGYSSDLSPSFPGVLQVIPNPVIDAAKVSLTLFEQQHVRLELVNMLGERMSVLIANTIQGIGTTEISLDTKGFANGMYYLILKSEMGWTKTVPVIVQ